MHALTMHCARVCSMAPLPFRGKVCHSAMIPHTALAIAAAKGVPVTDVLTAARRNARAMYGF